MHENKFEKQVMEKMDQLGFDPPDALWTHVELEINKEKKRRKPIFWFLLSGLLITGGVTFMIVNHVATNQDNLQDKSNQRAKRQSDKADHNVQANPTDKIVNARRDSASFQSGNPILIAAETRIGIKKIKGNTKETPVIENNTFQKPEDIGKPYVETGTTKGNAKNQDIPTAVARSEEQTNKTVRADSVFGKESAKIKNSEIKKSPWSIGFSGSAGASNINQSLFQSQNPANIAYAGYYPSNTGSGPSPVINTPSAVHAGFSFALGVSAKRNFSKRITGSIGLGYHYYSTGIHIGSSVDSMRTVYTGFAQATSVNSYYRNGNGEDYTNQYHFIELPVNLSFQLNKSRKTPVNWEAGVSFAWLLHSNALQFDPYTNVYFENDQLFNKIQWNALTAVLIGFPVHDHTIQFGPQFQYGLSSLLKNSSTYPGHLSYFGLKCTFIP